MKTLIIASISLLILISTCFAEEIPTDSMYLGQTLPGKTAKIFNLPASPGLFVSERITISSDNREIYYTELNGWPGTSLRIKCFKYLDNNKWNGPFVVFEGFVAPALSPDDSIMYMQKNITYTTSSTFYSKRTSTGWTTPQKLLSTDLTTHYYQKTNLNNYYVASTLPNSPGGNSDICKIKTNNTDTSMVSLGMPINTSLTENDFYISRNEDYQIICRFSSVGDLLISYKNQQGKWTNPKTLGLQVNTANWEASPFVTKDNKHMFFMRGNGSSNYHIYWVAIDNLIDSLKYTNYSPYLNKAIPNQTDTLGRAYSYSISDTTFIDDDGNNTLTYSATLSNGNPLPAWLTFNPDTKTFSSPSLSETGSFIIKVTAKDIALATVSSTFVLKVVNNVSISEERCFEQILQAYPNPFNPVTTIKFNTKENSLVKLSIYNLKGELVENLVNNTLEAGLHNFTFNANDLASGIYMYKLQIGNKIIAKSMLLLK